MDDGVRSDDADAGDDVDDAEDGSCNEGEGAAVSLLMGDDMDSARSRRGVRALDGLYGDWYEYE